MPIIVLYILHCLLYWTTDWSAMKILRPMSTLALLAFAAFGLTAQQDQTPPSFTVRDVGD